MIDFFFNAAPNPLKVGLFLEESGLEYRAIPIDTNLVSSIQTDTVLLIRIRKFLPLTTTARLYSTATQYFFT